MIRLIWIISLFICSVGLYQYHVEGWSRVTATLSINHAHIGVFLVFTIFLLAGYVPTIQFSLEKLSVILSLPVMVYVLFLSSSRAGIVALLFGLMVSILFMQSYIGRIFAVILIVTIVLLGINVFQNFQDYNLGAADFQNLEQDISLFGRFYIWYNTIIMISENPIVLVTGVGLGAFGEALDPYTPLLPGIASGGHNNFLHNLTETGVFGLIAFVYILFILLRTSLKRARQSERNDKSLYYGYFCGLSALVISALSQESLSVQTSQHNFLGYFFLVTALIFNIPSKREIEQNHNM